MSRELYEDMVRHKMKMEFFQKDIPAIIRGYKSHWQETFDKVQRDQLLEDVARHIETAISHVNERKPPI